MQRPVTVPEMTMRTRPRGFDEEEPHSPVKIIQPSPSQVSWRRPTVIVVLAMLSTLTVIRFLMGQTLNVDIRPTQPQCVVRVNTFRRNDLLARFIDHYDKCEAIARITVVWSDTKFDPPQWLHESSRIKVERHAVDSLNNRFKPLEIPEMEGVLSIDDDVFVSCDTVAEMVNAFTMAPRQMIGLAPRLVTTTRDNGFAYLRWWHVWWNGAYSFVLTKVAIFHRDYLTAYNSDAMASIRHHVHDHRNCEDIAMSFLVANATRAPAIWLRAPYTDYGQSIYKSHAGISASSDHIDIRQSCLALFADLFHHFPLVTGRLKLVHAPSQWLW